MNVRWLLLLGGGLIAAGAFAAVPDRYQAMADVDPIPLTVQCCEDGQCVPAAPDGCVPRAGPAQADRAQQNLNESVDRYASEALTLTRPRRTADQGASAEPVRDGTLGDHMAWMYDAPEVTNVVVGTVRETRGFFSVELGAPVTRCMMDVERALKGPPTNTILFHTLGATVDGFEAVASHAPRCQMGETALVFVADLWGLPFAVGSDEEYVVLGESREGQSRWAAHAVSFVEHLERGEE